MTDQPEARTECGVMGLCDLPPGHKGKHQTTVDRAAALAPDEGLREALKVAEDALDILASAGVPFAPDGVSITSNSIARHALREVRRALVSQPVPEPIGDEACIGDPSHQYHSHDDDPEPVPEPGQCPDRCGGIVGHAGPHQSSDYDPNPPLDVARLSRAIGGLTERIGIQFWREPIPGAAALIAAEYARLTSPEPTPEEPRAE